MILPNAASAFLDIRKLTDYVLDSDHSLGRHKARVFKAALGITSVDAAWLSEAIMSGIRSAEATELNSDRFGTRFQVDLTVRRQDHEAVVRTIWIYTWPANGPRFVTAWIL